MERTAGSLTPGLRVAAIAVSPTDGCAHLVAMLFVLRVAKTVGAEDARRIGTAIPTADIFFYRINQFRHLNNSVNAFGLLPVGGFSHTKDSATQSRRVVIFRQLFPHFVWIPSRSSTQELLEGKDHLSDHLGLIV